MGWLPPKIIDTDSFAFKIETDDMDSELEKLRDVMDFSNYPKDHRLYSNSNQKRSGFFKDESG